MLGGALLIVGGIWLFLQTTVGGLPARLLSRRDYAPGESPAELGAASASGATGAGANSSGAPFGSVASIAGAGAPTLGRSGDVTLDQAVLGSWERMRDAAARDGVAIRAASSYRDPGEQLALRRQYCTGDPYDPNAPCSRPVALPGKSDHQRGRAVDIVQSAGAVEWMRAHAGAYGWAETVDGEPWHWANKGGS